MSRATIRKRAQMKYHGLRPRYEDNTCNDCDYFVDEFKDPYGFTHTNHCRRKMKRVNPSHAACRGFAYRKVSRRKKKARSDPRKDHPIEILESVVKKRHECLKKLNSGSKKVR